MSSITKMVEVELLQAFDDGRWDTIIQEIPEKVAYTDNKSDREAIISWVEEHLQGQAQYCNVVAWQLYAISEDQFQEDD